MGPPIGDYVTALYRALGLLSVAVLVLAPLAVWKLVEIVWWLASHLHWS
jgi:hypothetical protein